MSLKVKVYSDYICPYCYLAKDQFMKSIQGRDVEVEWLPYELRQKPEAPLDPIHDPDMLAAWDLHIIPRMEAWDITMKLPAMSPHPYTDLAHEGYFYAKDFNKAHEYHDKVFNAFFQEEKNIGEIQVLAGIAEEIGLDKEAFTRALEAGIYRKEEKSAMRYANEEIMINVVPTFIIGDRKIEGAASKEMFDEEFERVGAFKV